MSYYIIHWGICMELEKMSILDYALMEIESLFDPDEKAYKDFVNYVTFLFTSQGIANVPFLDFEVEFPELVHNIPELINFVESKEGQIRIGKMLRKNFYVDLKVNDKNSNVFYYDYDPDDYEKSQKISHIPFHM